MPFAYYARLSRARQGIYRRSDAIDQIQLPDPARLTDLPKRLEWSLDSEDRTAVEELSQKISDEILEQLQISKVQIIVREVRPSDDFGELHGLYEPEEGPYACRVFLWMRTAARANIVAFRTFLRTLLHELCHHLDYELYHLEETFHTEGFYKRESSLFHQIMDTEDEEK